MAGATDRSPIRRLRHRIRTDRELRTRVKKAVGLVTLGIVLAWFLLPLFWVVQTSLKTRPLAQAYPPVFWGFEIQWSNYVKVLTDTDLLDFMRNGIISATGSTFIALLFGVPHAYAISKYEFKYGQLSLLAILAVRIVPPISIAVPFFVMYNNLGLFDTLVGNVLVLGFLFEPFVVWIMKGFFDGLPSSLIEAARIDGCTKFQVFYQIMLPLAKPALGSATIISWLLSWNEFTLVFILTSSNSAQTLPVGILGFTRDLFVPWNIISAAAVLGLIPSLFVVVLFQRYLIKGLAERRV